ncbi:MAG: hypothetical protein ACNA7M_11485 [Roseovarius sp.]
MSKLPRPGMDQTGLNLIRIVIGSYFLAVSLDLVSGFDAATLFAPLVPPAAADLIGATLLFCLSAALMAGLHLRLAALSLALLIFCSSLLQNLIVVTPESLSAFWRDLTLAASVLLTYLTLGPGALRRASVLAHRARLRRAMAQRAINPRRIQPQTARKRPVQQEIRTALATAPPQQPMPRDKDTVDNIFANI